MRFLRRPAFSLVLLTAAAPARALGPADVFILVNKNVPESRQVADHYCRKRGVPQANVIPLDLPAGEDISRRDYNTRLVAPLREALKERRDKAKVLLSVYGVPLRVGPQEPNKEEAAELAKLQPQINRLRGEEQQLQQEITGLETESKEDPPGVLAQTLRERRQERDALREQWEPLDERRQRLAYEESQACVDSELSLMWWDHYELRRWQLNLLYFQVPEALRKDKPPLLMVSRLDGPTPALAMRLVDQAIAVEAKGLSGKVYVDARGIGYDPKHDTGHGYGGYDESLREMARLLASEAK